MQIYCSSCKKHTDNINAELYRTKNDRPYVISTCDICFKRKSQLLEMVMNVSLKMKMIEMDHTILGGIISMIILFLLLFLLLLL